MMLTEGDGEKKHNCFGALEHCEYLQHAQSKVANIQFENIFKKKYSRQFKRKTEDCMMTYQADVIKMIKAGYDESSVSIFNYRIFLILIIMLT